MTPDDSADLYTDLGLTREASRAAITRAYRALVAYAVLADPERRASYDRQQPALTG